ncbi:non-ribosomal peptide synthetase [Streptomyces sp. UH6]|uniref:non-ribosomal peptide synthetase n=1 Tax=Streptomyces sp. UH6 TaxID=2748379 RepID=UPI0015D49B8B|nr:non-ribosomal peptide synthetase [Streptomyces sp. UH6]NYV75302.1 non-ribosomal peptide synthetase [Streptomyces sp. UH6]
MAIGAVPLPYTRPVSPMEAWFLVYPDSVPGVMHLLVEGTGVITGPQLADAVEQAARSCPGTRLTRDGMTWKDSGTAPEVRELPPGGLDLAVDPPELHRPLMGDPGPTCEVLLSSGDGSTRVVFRAFHGALDGKGLMFWAEEVFRALRGEPLHGAPDAVSEAELLDRLDARGVTSSPGVEADLEWPSALGARRAGGGRGFFWRRRTVDGSHPGAVAKVALAVTRARGLDTGRFMVPVDLRRHAPELRSTGNLTHNPLLEVDADSGWEEAHERMLTLLAGNHDLAARADTVMTQVPLDVLRRQIAELDGYSAARNKYAALAIVSHMGRVDEAALSTDAFRATEVFVLPNSGPVGPPEIDLVEFGGRTEITIGWHDEPGTAQRAEALLDAIEEELSPAHRRRWAGNAAPRALSRTGTVVEQFEAQVARTPDAVALTGPEGPVDYAELNRRADAVAAELQDRGVGRGSVVGLAVGRTVAAMAGVWGVLKAGAAYLPLDPAHPDQRLKGLLRDARVSVCLVGSDLAKRDLVPVGCEAAVVEDLAGRGGRPVPAGVRPDDLAYVIYTSGSTGRPKGVEIEHAQLSVFADWAIPLYGVDDTTRFPLFTSLAFDLSNTALFLPLLVGGSVALVPDDLDHTVLREMLTSSGANALKLTPTHLDLISRLGLRPVGFRTVVAGGELLRGAVAARAQEIFGPQCRIFNEYGPTETTIGCMSRRFDPERDAELPSVPIGLPTPNTAIHLLDARGCFVEPGEVGEMFLAGDQLARGYRGRPDLDAERFVRLADGTRAYRSGDLARLLPSGELESAGRTDEQVKVHGHRVEPAEIARILEEHPSVASAFAAGLTRPGTTDRTLCAWAVAAGDGTPTDLLPLLEDHLRERLPRYMVPSTILLIPELPLTHNGKVDVSALPRPSGAAEPSQGSGDAGGFAGSRDEVEETIAEIWTEVLGLPADRLGQDPDFHALGGDSVSLLTMLARVSSDVVGREGEKEFMSHLAGFIARPTLRHVSEVARRLS